MRTFTSVALASIAVLGAACGGSVVAGGGGEGGNGGASATGTSTGAPGSTSTSTGTGVGGGPSAVLYGHGELTLRVATFPLSCAEPDVSSPYGQCSWADLEVRFPEELLVPGPLPSGSASYFISEAGAPQSSTPGDCSGTAAISGGGDIPGVGVEFGSIGATSVVVTLSQADDFLIDGHLDGTYTVARCP